MLPVRDVRLDEALVIGQNRLDRLRRLWWRGREERPESARLDARQHVPLPHSRKVVRHDVHGGVGRSPKLLEVHVADAGPLLLVQLVVLEPAERAAPARFIHDRHSSRVRSAGRSGRSSAMEFTLRRPAGLSPGPT